MEAVKPDLDLDRFRTVEEFESRLTDVREAITAIDAQYGTREITGEDKDEWNLLNEERDLLVARLKHLQNRRNRIAAVTDEDQLEDGDGTKLRAAPQVTRDAGYTWDMGEIRSQSRTPEELRQKLRDNAMHFVEQEQFHGKNREDAQTHVEYLFKTVRGPVEGFGTDEGAAQEELARRILLTGSPVYRRAFFKQLAGKGLSPEEQRALSVGTGSAGGMALVYNLDPTIVPTSNFSVNPYRAISRVETIAGTNEWRAVTSGSITAAYGAEALETTDNSPTLSQPAIIVEKAQAFVPYSIEIGEDWGALESEMGQLLQDAKDDLESTKFTLGAGHGSTEPKGLVTAATSTVGTTTTAAFVIADIYALIQAIPPRFRPRAEFVANLAIINKVRQFDTSGGSGVWIGPQGLQADATAGAAGPYPGGVGVPLLGRRFSEVSAMDAVLTTGSEIIVGGDFRYFVIVDRVGMSIEVVPHLFGTVANFPTGQRGLYAHWRNSSDVLNAAAFRTLRT